MIQHVRRSLVALVALASITSVLWLESFGPHTDDGCRTEVHCLACRTALVRAAGSPPVLAAPVVVPLDHVVVQTVDPALDVALSAHSSRGPPPSA